MLVAAAFGQQTTGRIAEPNAADETSLPEIRLINTLVRDNLFVIKISRMALLRSESADVKDLAQNIISYHTQMGEALIWLSRESGVAIAGNRLSALSGERAGVLDRLHELEGAAFDKVYLGAVADAHDTVAAALGQLPNVATNPAMQFLATSAVPTINDHLRTARTLMQ